MFAVNGRFVNGCVASMTFGALGSWVCGYGMESVEVRGDRNMVSAETGVILPGRSLEDTGAGGGT